MTSFVIIGLEELFPLWAATQHSLGKLTIVPDESFKKVLSVIATGLKTSENVRYDLQNRAPILLIY